MAGPNAPIATTAEFRQKRGPVRTHFRFTPTGLLYRVEQKGQGSQERQVDFDTVQPWSSHRHSVQADSTARFAILLVTGLSLFGVFRQHENLPALASFLIVTSLLLLTLGGVLVTARWRRVAFTCIPAEGGHIVVIRDAQHDAIVAEIENGRRTAARRLTKPHPGMSVRQYLRVLRWLTDIEAITEAERGSFAAAVGAVDPQPPSPPATTPLQIFRQRRLGLAVDVALYEDRLTYRQAMLFGGETQFTYRYSDLPEREDLTHERAHTTLLVLGIGFAGAIIMSASSAVDQAHPRGYYVGNIGLGHALTDFGPLLLMLFVAIGVLAALFQHRLIQPWADLLLLRGKSGDAIVAAIEARRLADLRKLAALDPLRTVDEHAYLLDHLLADGVIDTTEHDRSLAAAQAAGDRDDLDRLLGEAEAEEEPEEEADTPARQRMLH